MVPNKRNKIVSLLCAAALLLSVCGIAANAAGEYTYHLSGDQVTDIVNIAGTQIGYATASDGTTKYGAYLGYPDMDWCGAFIAWCAHEAGIGTDVIPKNGSSNAIKNFYADRSRYKASPYRGGEEDPLVGDIAFISNAGTSEIDHVGLVVKTTDTTVTTIEGNYGSSTGKVTRVEHALYDAKFVGFASPAYTFVTGVRILNEAMNLRTAPSVTGSSVLVTIPTGSEVKVTSVSGDWGAVSYNGMNGWIYLRYSLLITDAPVVIPEGPEEPEIPGDPNALYLVADVSEFNSPSRIDWAQLKKNGVQGVIIRIGGRYYGPSKALYTDDAFLTHYRNAKAAGLHVGAYFFSYALSAEQAEEEARLTIDILTRNNCKLDMPVFIDMEDFANGGEYDYQHYYAGKAVCSLVINTFCEMIRAAGFYPGVYSNPYFSSTLLDASVFSGRAVWIAHYAQQCGYTGRYDMWQFTSSANLPGYDGELDISYCYTDFPSVIGQHVHEQAFGDHKPAADWTVVTKPTCTSTGKKVKKCTDCGLTLLTEYLPKSAHTESEQCILPGNPMVRVFDKLTDQQRAALINKSAAGYAAASAALPKNGGTVLTYCRTCGEVLHVTYTFAGETHGEGTTKNVSPTCIAEGIDRTVCSDCWKTVEEKYVPYGEHVFGASTLTGSTANEGGLRTTRCAVCGEVFREEFVAVSDHDFDDGVMTETVTFKKGGTVVYTCRQCGEKMTQTSDKLVYGDVSGNGVVEPADARLALRAALGLEHLNILQTAAGDVTHTGAVDVSDARLILRISLGLENSAALFAHYYPGQ